MSKKLVPTFPETTVDFAKSNGTERFFFTEGPSLCRAEFADECDINKLMARYDGFNTGVNNLPNPENMRYVDFTDIPDTLLGYMEFMDNANAAFMTLPATIRREFNNNAHEFCEFASDPANVDIMVEWKLAAPKANWVDPKAAPKGADAPPPPPADKSTPPTGDAPKAS